jgi:hypothetical protein
VPDYLRTGLTTYTSALTCKAFVYLHGFVTDLNYNFDVTQNATLSRVCYCNMQPNDDVIIYNIFLLYSFRLRYDATAKDNHIPTFRKYILFSSSNVNGWFTFEDDRSKYFRNVGIRLPCYATSYPTITKSSATHLRKPKTHTILLNDVFWHSETIYSRTRL